MQEKDNAQYTPVLKLDTETPPLPSLKVSTGDQALQAGTQSKDIAEPLDESRLTEEEKRAVEEFAGQIDITNTNQVLAYGVASQKNIAGFSESALSKVRTKDMGQVGGMITDLVVELKGFDTEDKKGILGLFRKLGNQIEGLKARYDKVEANVDKISNVLEDHQVTLLKDIAMLDKMYDLNLAYFKELTMYILAGKKKLAEVKNNELPALQKKAQESGLPEDAQAANDLNAMISRFDKRLYDLELTRIISVQMAPQIRLVQNNNSLMVEKIQSSLNNTIPLWKSQMVLALGINDSKEAMEAQRAVTDMTNELLRKNSEMLKQGTIETVRESERGIVDIETLKATNENLISTLDEVAAIQKEGAQRRREAEAELSRIEGELKNKLLELRE